MYSILPLNEENISGLIYLEFAPVSSVQSIARAWKDEINTAVVLLPGKQFYQMAFTRETASFSCPKESSPNGSVHKLTISCEVPMMKKATAANFTEMKEDLFIVIARDSNGNRRLCGTMTDPVRFDYIENSLASFGKRSGYTVKFYRDLQHAPPYYTA